MLGIWSASSLSMALKAQAMGIPNSREPIGCNTASIVTDLFSVPSLKLKFLFPIQMKQSQMIPDKSQRSGKNINAQRKLLLTRHQSKEIFFPKLIIFAETAFFSLD